MRLRLAALALFAAPAWADPPALELSADEQELLAATNAERKQAGLAELTPAPKLFAAARAHAANMAKQDKLSHELDGQHLPDRLQAAGYALAKAAENIAHNQSSPKEAVAAWMKSEGHKANLLDADVTEVGLAAAKNAAGEPYWVQVFGKPR